MPDSRYLYVHRDDMRRWQLATLEVQQNLQVLFEQAGITAWCGGGTLIGAVRNGGFLYWDNDLDMFFLHNDYRKILKAFWQYKFLENYEIYCNTDGFWEKHEALNALLRQEVLDEKLLDFELESISKTMMKIFARHGVPVTFQASPGTGDDMVSIKHTVRHHLTKKRLASLDDSVVCGEVYKALPNVCMLPMLNIKYKTYITLNMIFLVFSVVNRISLYVENLLNYIADNGRVSTGLSPRSTRYKNFGSVRIDPIKNKLRLVFRRISKMLIKLMNNKERSGNFIAYRQAFFRFEVMPYPEDLVFPLKKMPFESVEIYVPNRHEEILKIQFGDYMKVPPPEKRFGLPFFLEGRV